MCQHCLSRKASVLQEPEIKGSSLECGVYPVCVPRFAWRILWLHVLGNVLASNYIDVHWGCMILLGLDVGDGNSVRIETSILELRSPCLYLSLISTSLSIVIFEVRTTIPDSLWNNATPPYRKRLCNYEVYRLINDTSSPENYEFSYWAWICVFKDRRSRSRHLFSDCRARSWLIDDGYIVPSQYQCHQCNRILADLWASLQGFSWPFMSVRRCRLEWRIPQDRRQSEHQTRLRRLRIQYGRPEPAIDNDNPKSWRRKQRRRQRIRIETKRPGIQWQSLLQTCSKFVSQLLPP